MQSARRSPDPDIRARVSERISLVERIRHRFRRREEARELELPWFLDGVTVLGPEGSAEVMAEIEHGSPLTPERRATFARMERRAEIRKRLAAEEASVKPG